MGKVLLLGISGATWRIIDPLLSRGRLPTLRRLIDTGCRGTLLSARPAGDKHFRPQTAWPSIATGKPPEQHGVTRFFHRFDDVVAPTVWEHFESAGKRVGLFNWPITWPVRPVNGFMIPAYDGRDTATFPPELSYLRTLDRRQEAARAGGEANSPLAAGEGKSLLSKLRRGGVTMSTFAHLALTAADVKLRAPQQLRPLLLRQARLRISGDIFLNLCRQYRPDFCAFVTFVADYAMHRFWLFHEPHLFADAPRDVHPRLRGAVEGAYEAIDAEFGRILKSFGKDVTVAVVSEHGMNPEIESAEIGPDHWILRPNRLREFVGLDANVAAAPVARWIAFAPADGDVENVAEKFRAVTIDGTGEPLFQLHTHRGEVIVKLALTRETHGNIRDLSELNIRIGNRVEPFEHIAQRFGRRRSAMHAEEAIIILNGPGVKRRADLGRASVMDVAPTLLKLAGISGGAAMGGRVLDVAT